MEYDWRADAIASWHLALRMMALACGSVQFKSLPELYWQESKGVIP